MYLDQDGNPIPGASTDTYLAVGVPGSVAGFEMARTIEQGYVKVGSDKLALPCVRINFGMGVAALKDLIG